jgi:hypothetical protein
MKLEFSQQIFEKVKKYQVSSKSIQWEPSCSMRTDNITKLIVAFRDFANAPKNGFCKLSVSHVIRSLI